MTVQKGGWDYFQEGKAAMGDASGNPVTDSSGNPAANVVAETTSRAGEWSSQTYDDVTNTVQSKEIPASAIELRATYYDVASGSGVAMGIAIGAANSTAGDAAIDAGTTPQLPLGNNASWDFNADDAVTRVDFKTVAAETGTTKFVLEWKV